MDINLGCTAIHHVAITVTLSFIRNIELHFKSTTCRFARCFSSLLFDLLSSGIIVNFELIVNLELVGSWKQLFSSSGMFVYDVVDVTLLLGRRQVQ
jgi:hypothetical protein